MDKISASFMEEHKAAFIYRRRASSLYFKRYPLGIHVCPFVPSCLALLEEVVITHTGKYRLSCISMDSFWYYIRDGTRYRLDFATVSREDYFGRKEQVRVQSSLINHRPAENIANNCIHVSLEGQSLWKD